MNFPKFNYFKTKKSFNSTPIDSTDITFIEETLEIYTHGIIFKCDINNNDVRLLLKIVDFKNPDEVTNITLEGSTYQEAIEKIYKMIYDNQNTLESSLEKLDDIKAQELIRLSNEETRINNENSRISNESVRLQNEDIRIDNENNRISAENARVTEYSKLKEQASTILSTINTAIDNADKSSLYATEQGDYAKEQGNILNDRISALELLHDSDFYLEKNYCVGAWVENDLSPDSIKTYGDETMLYNAYHKVLIDATDNTGKATTPVGELNDENLFRFSDGRFAPAVCISEAQYADSLLTLYIKNGDNYTQYCSAGNYSSEDYLENILRPIVQSTPNDLSSAKLYKLVNDDYTEAHAVLPWETIETKYNLCLANKYPLYLLDNIIGNSGYRWKGIFNYPAVWDGIDVSLYKLSQTAMCLSPVAVINNKTSSFFYNYTSEGIYCSGCKGLNNLCSEFYNDGTYPSVRLNLIDNMNYARANNSDTTNPYPCSEGGFHSYNTLLNSLEIANHTKYLHDPNKYSSGISSNDECNSEETFFFNGGCRYRVSETSTWSYCKFNETPEIAYDTKGNTMNLSYILNSYYPKEQCMESQIAYSWAKEFGIAEQLHYKAYNGEYWYSQISKGMNARVYRLRNFIFSAYNKSGKSTKFETQIVLRMALYNGMSLSGNIFIYRSGGYEIVGTANGNTTNCTIKVYLLPNQTRWHNLSTEKLNNLGVFDFEKTYNYLGSYLNIDGNFVKTRQSYSNSLLEEGGSMDTGECYYNKSKNNWSSTKNQRCRVALRLGGEDHYELSGPRSTYSRYLITQADGDIGISAQFLV